jgi:tight adherence protein B
MAIELLAALCTALAVGLFVAWIARRGRYHPEDMRLRRLGDRPNAVRRGLSWDELRRRGPSSLPLLRTLLEDSAWAHRTALQIEQAGIKLRVGEYLITRLAIGSSTFVAIAFIGKSLVTTVLAVVAGFLGFMLPAAWLALLRGRRMDRFKKQLPEAVVMLSNALRAGFAFQHGISLVAEQMEAPTSEEFTRMMVDMNVGASIEDALAGLLERMNCEEVNLVVTAVMIQRSSGGNLSEILDSVGEQMRERERLFGEVRTMTSQQRFSGTVMTFWPVLLLGLFALINWGQTKILFTTPAGLVMLGIGGGLQMLGYFTIRRILDVEI